MYLFQGLNRNYFFPFFVFEMGCFDYPCTKNCNHVNSRQIETSTANTAVQNLVF
jgi:hypothetical protein